MVPLGGIIAWGGAIVDIPAGYQLCDGTNGTPDMLNKFQIGAGQIYNPGDSGGASAHSHPFTGDGHQHGPGGTKNVMAGIDATVWENLSSGSADATGDTDNASSLPPYYALAYIQRMV